MFLRTRMYLGEMLFAGAVILSRAGNAIAARPKVHLARPVAIGDRAIELDARVPGLGIVQGVRMVGATADEIAKVLRAEGTTLGLDRPLAQAYPKGAEVRVLA